MMVPTGPEHTETWGTDVVESTVLGAPCQVFERRRQSVPELLLDGRRFADREYLVSTTRSVTFAQHELAVSATGELLRRKGVRPGDRVVILAPNSVEWVVSFWATLSIGAIVVIANAWWSGHELRHAITTTDPRVVVADDKRLANVPNGVATISTTEIAAAPAIAGGFVSDDPCPDEDAPAVVLFTSGTTGSPKGAVLSHRGIIATLQALAVVTSRLRPEGEALPNPSRSLLSLPLFHVGGLQQIITPMVAGGTLVFFAGRFDAARIVDLIERAQITVWSAVPTMVTRVIDYLAARDAGPLHGVRTVGLGGSPVSAVLRQSVATWFPGAKSGAALTYGLSEAGGVVATGVGGAVQSRPGCVGKPLPCTSVRILEPNQSGAGEIAVRSPSVMLGYWDPSAPGNLASDGPLTVDRWLLSGDIGSIDDDGFLYVVDRSKDIVIRGGENIATPNVENRLLEHPAVRDAVVVGLPHHELGEEVGAALVLRPDANVTETELADFCRQTLAYFEVPSRWWIRTDEFPQNHTGKTLKGVVRSEWVQRIETSRVVAQNADRP